MHRASGELLRTFAVERSICCLFCQENFSYDQNFLDDLCRYDSEVAELPSVSFSSVQVLLMNQQLARKIRYATLKAKPMLTISLNEPWACTGSCPQTKVRRSSWKYVKVGESPLPVALSTQKSLKVYFK